MGLASSPAGQNTRVWQKVAASDVLAQADARETKLLWEKMTRIKKSF